jgi:hypothetical protein
MAGSLLRGLCCGCGAPVNCAAVDGDVDEPVESGDGQGINGRCPVDDGSFSAGPGQRPCVLGRRGGRTASPLKTCSLRRRLREAARPGRPVTRRRGTRPVAASWRTAAGQPATRAAWARRGPSISYMEGPRSLCGVTERAVRYGAPDSPVGLFPGPYRRQTATASGNGRFGYCPSFRPGPGQARPRVFSARQSRHGATLAVTLRARNPCAPGEPGPRRLASRPEIGIDRGVHESGGPRRRHRRY